MEFKKKIRLDALTIIDQLMFVNEAGTYILQVLDFDEHGQSRFYNFLLTNFTDALSCLLMIKKRIENAS